MQIKVIYVICFILNKSKWLKVMNVIFGMVNKIIGDFYNVKGR
tara:strand:+ start:96 stop:224 length:129 start_codon:yes stop_codon:yes gene_type:complete